MKLCFVKIRVTSIFLERIESAISTRFNFYTKILCAIVAFSASLNCASAVLSEPPSTVDSKAFYMFYLHGKFPEMQGADAFHRLYGRRYETTAIANELSKNGFTVITEIRNRETTIDGYGAKIAKQVNSLLERGVLPEQIIVMGHSKGGLIAMNVASKVSAVGVRYVILAGCIRPTVTNIGGENPRKEYIERVEKDAGSAKGSMLSLHDVQDDLAYSCSEFIEASKSLNAEEQQINTGSRPGYGHAAFYAPHPKWLEPILVWLKK